MDTPQDIKADELWDPDAQRRAILAMTPSERLRLMADLCRQAAVFERLAIRP